MSKPSNHNTVQITQNQDLDAIQVKDFLLANPDFFNRFPLLAEQIQISHQKRGAVSLVELQSEQLREKVTELQDKINQLMSVAQQNERIYRLYAELNLRLYQCNSVEAMLDTLQQSIEQQFDLAAVNLKTHSVNESLPEEWQEFKGKRFKEKHFFFGRLTQAENKLLFGGAEVESVALMLLGDKGELGILAIASNEPDHFSPEMDTLLIAQLQQLMTLLVSKVMT